MKVKHKGKFVPVLNKVRRLEDVLGSGDIAPLILDLGTSWIVISFTPRPLYPRGKNIRYPVERRLGGLLTQPGRCGEERNSSRCTCR
jgi:hypothetical protein